MIFLTRSLAAFTLMVLADISPQEASKSIVDGGQDNGIDSIYFDRREKIMYILQSKWKQDSKGSIKTDEVMKFTKGFKDLVNAKYDRFNSKFNNKTKEIEEALNDAGIRFEIILVYSGQTPLADEPQRELDDLLEEMNDPIDIVSKKIINQSNIYNIISQGASGNPINLDICLFDWGQNLVYKALPDSFFNISSDLTTEQIDEIKSMTLKFLGNVMSESSNLFPTSYPANIFRNVTKCQ